MTEPFFSSRHVLAPWLLATSLSTLSPVWAAGGDAGPSDGLIEKALGGIELVVDKELDAEDRAWLREYWRTNAVDRPEETVAGLEAIAVARKGIVDGDDPMILAKLRTELIDQSYCATKRTSDGATRRMQEILAPADLVLVADCVTGVVVTPFDIKALSRSHAKVGELVGSSVDAAALEADLFDDLPGSFPHLNLEQQQRLLWGELRTAALEAYWSSIDEASHERLAAVAQDAFNDTGDIAAAAFSLEMTALKQVGEVKAITRAGGYRFAASELQTFLEFIQTVTGTSLSPGERAEIADIYVGDFHDDPKGVTEVAANLRHWLDKGQYFGEDSKSGRIRSWTAEEQMEMRRTEVAHLFCHNERSGRHDNKRFIEIVFAEDPVTDSDCANNRITRESDRVLVDNGKREFTRAELDAHRQAFELIFAIHFSSDERRWLDRASIEDVQNGSLGLTQAVDGFQRIAQEIKEPAKVGPHINEMRREDYAIRIHCANKTIDDPDVARLFELINGHDPILFEECERGVIVRESDVGGLVSMLNFVGSLADFDPLTDDEIAALPGKIEPFFETRTDGPFRYLSIFAKLSFWWSSMPVEARHRTVSMVKEAVTSRGGIDAYVSSLSARASNQINRQALCEFQLKQLAYNTRRVGLSSRAIFDTNPHADNPWVNPEAMDDDIAYYGIMAPFVQETCGDVWR